MGVKGERPASKDDARQTCVLSCVVFAVFAVGVAPPLLHQLKSKSADAVLTVLRVLRVLRDVAGYRT